MTERAANCPHGCGTALNCRGLDQGGSLPAGCPYNLPADASSNRVQRAGMCGPDCPEEPDGCEWGKCPYCEGADAIPNRVPDACGDDECEDMCGPVDASGNYTRCRATRNRVATNLELRNSVARLIAIVIANAPKHYDASMVAEDIIDRLDLNGCNIVNRRAT